MFVSAPKTTCTAQYVLRAALHEKARPSNPTGTQAPLRLTSSSSLYTVRHVPTCLHLVKPVAKIKHRLAFFNVAKVCRHVRPQLGLSEIQVVGVFFVEFVQLSKTRIASGKDCTLLM